MRRALIVIKIVFTVGLLASVLAAADLQGLIHYIGGASIPYCAAAVVVLVFQTLVLAGRFHAIVTALGRPITPRTAIELSFVGVLFNQALPSAIGGDAIRMWRLRADGCSWRDAVNAVLVDRGGGVLVLAVLAAVAISLERSGAFSRLEAGLWIVAALGVAGGVGLAVADLLALPPGAHRVLASSNLPASVRAVFGTRVALGAIASSAASHLLAALAAYWLALALGVSVSLGPFLTAVLCVLLATMIPLSYAGWGIREVGAVWLFAQLGIAAEVALAISMLFGAALFLAALPGLVFWLAPRKLPPRASVP